MSGSQQARQDQPHPPVGMVQDQTDFNDRATRSFLDAQAQAAQQQMNAPPSGYRQDQGAYDRYDGATAIPPSQQQQWQGQVDPQLSQGAGWAPQYADPGPVSYAHPVDMVQQQAENPALYQQNGTNEDFLLMDVVGGGCANQSGRFASRSVAVLHPTKPVVAYSAGCMIIVYDLLSDSKVNLVGHQHDVYALAFAPGGESLISVDFNRNAELQDNLNAQGGMAQESTSQVFLWDWQRGTCLQEAPIPRSQNLSMILAPPSGAAGMAAGTSQMGSQDRTGIYSHVPGFHLTGPAENNPTTCNIQVSIEKSGTMFMILESSPLEIGGGYRITLWSFNKQQVMEMISSMDLELQSPCIDLSFLPRTQSDILSAQRSAGQSNHSAQVFLNSRLPFLTVEKQCIKLWEYSQGNAQLKKRIHIKQNIASMQISDLTNFFLLLGESGKVLILDQQGEFVSTVAKDGVVFTKIGTAHDKLLLGTNRGTVHVYHMASLQFISEVPYQLSFLEKFSLNSFSQSTIEIEQLSLQKVGPPVSSMGTTQNLRFLWIRYQDGSFAVIDRTIMNPRQAILGYSCGHFENISGMQWVPPRSSLDLVSRPGGFANLTNQSAFGGLGGYLGQEAAFPGQGGAQATHDQQFVTCAHDLSIHLWRHYGDRWAFSYIDVAKSFDQALSFQRKQCDRSTRELKLTALCLYPRSNNLVVGDSKGFVRVFQLVNENAHLIATYRLPRSQEVKAERALGISENPIASRLGVGGIDEEFSNDQIKEIYITKNESTAVITFQSGMISFYDTKNGYTWIGDAVDQDVSKFNTQQAAGNFLAIQTQIIEVGDGNSVGGLGTSFKDRMQQYHQKTPLQQDERPFSQSGSPMSDLSRARGGSMSFPKSAHGGYTSSLKILSLQTPNQIAMQLVDVKGSKLARSPLCQYVISEGKVTGFDLHPSGDYLLATSSKGRVYVFRIDTGELRGTIRIPLNASGCQVDPSGLYVVVKVPAFANLNAMNLASGGGASQLATQIGHFGANEKDLARNTILMYEIGTGMPAAEICSVFEISEMRFSCDGRFLALGSTSGAISVWSMGSHLHQNVKQVLDAMKLSNDFWFNYPIFLPDSEQFNQGAGDVPPQISQEDAAHLSAAQRGQNLSASEYREDNNRMRNNQNLNRSFQTPAQNFSENRELTAEVAQSQSQYHQDAVNSQRQFYDDQQVQPLPAQNYQQFSRPDARQDQLNQEQSAMQPQYPSRNPYDQQEYGYPAAQAPSAYRPQQSMTAAGNEQRFMRKSFADPAPTPHQLRLAQQIGQVGGADLQAQQEYRRQRDQQDYHDRLLASQRNVNGGLYQANLGQAPPMHLNPAPVHPQGNQAAQHAPVYYPNQSGVPQYAPAQRSARPGQYGQADGLYGQQLQWAQQQRLEPHSLPRAPSARGASAPYTADRTSRQQPNQFGYQNNAMIPQYAPANPWPQDNEGQIEHNMGDPNFAAGHPNNVYNAHDAGQYQQRAAATLLGGAPREAPKVNVENVDLSEPVPFNQSQLLYGQPVHATVGGADTLAKSRTFERYADFGPAGAGTGQLAYRPHAEALQGPNAMAGQAQPAAFDQSLNERVAMATHSPRMLAGNEVGGGVMGPQLAGPGQNREMMFMDQARNQLEASAAAARQAQPGSAAVEKDAIAMTQAQRPGEPLNAYAEARDVDIRQNQATEFRPAGFSNTLTQQDILQGRAGLKPDPEDIDAGLRNAGHAGASVPIAGGAPQRETSAQMVQELEGMNRYMYGVRMHDALGGPPHGPQQTVTLKNLRQGEANAFPLQRGPQSRVGQLYKAMPASVPNQAPAMRPSPTGARWAGQPPLGVRAPIPRAPGSVSESQEKSGIKSSTRDVVDEMYQSIDDFEQRLAGRGYAQY